MNETTTTRNSVLARLLTVALLVFVAQAAGATADGRDSNDQAPGDSVAQTLCPVMTANPIKPEFHVDYKGKRVYLCCKLCLETFKAAPDKYLAALPQFGDPQAPPTVDEVSHDHAADHGQPHGAARLVRFAGKFHPVAAHFPIALVIAAAVAELLAAVTGRSFFRDAGRFAIVLGALSAVCAATLGWATAAFADYQTDFARTLWRHGWLGTSVAGLAVVGAVLSELSHRRDSRAAAAGYRIVLAMSVVAVALVGYLGGTLVYGPNHYAW